MEEGSESRWRGLVLGLCMYGDGILENPRRCYRSRMSLELVKIE
jgi:hypothetical protein